MVGGSPVVNLVKHFMIVIYNSRVVCLGKCPYYHCRVVIYACKMFIRLATGLVVMGGDSCSKGHEFESLRQILDGHYFTLICCKNCIVWLKRPKITEKEAGVGPFFKKMIRWSMMIEQTSFIRAGFTFCCFHRIRTNIGKHFTLTKF